MSEMKVKAEEMTLEEFRTLSEEGEQFVSEWDVSKFKIQCRCGSHNTALFVQGKQYGAGSEYTGPWTRSDGGLMVKCWECGQAMILGEIED